MFTFIHLIINLIKIKIIKTFHLALIDSVFLSDTGCIHNALVHIGKIFCKPLLKMTETLKYQR